MPDIGVHAVGKINRRALLGQLLDIPVRSEHINLFREQVDLHRRHELFRIFEFFLPLEHLPQPAKTALVGSLGTLAFLVFPVRRDPLFGNPMHFGGTNLYFHALAGRPKHRGVQGLVHVGLGHGDVILETPGDRLPGGVNSAEHGITVAHGRNDDAKSDQIVNLVKVDLLLDDFVVDGANVLEPPLYLSIDLMLLQNIVQTLFDIFDIGTGLASVGLYLFGEIFINSRFKIT